MSEYYNGSMSSCKVDGKEDCFKIFGFYRFTGILFSVQPPAAPSFVARRKIEEKDTPKGSEAALWNLAFIRGKEGRRAYSLRVRRDAIDAI